MKTNLTLVALSPVVFGATWFLWSLCIRLNYPSKPFNIEQAGFAFCLALASFAGMAVLVVNRVDKK